MSFFITIAITFSMLLTSTFANAETNPLFTRGYDYWKSEFRAIAANLRSEDPTVEVGRLPIPNLIEANLGIDYLYLPARNNPRNLVVVSSGVHGVEATAGVVIQHLLLNQCFNTEFDRSNTAVLVVHVMNPYGAKYGRRFNANSIDLNRNCFDAQRAKDFGFPGLGIRNEAYRKHESLFRGPVSQVDLIASGLWYGETELSNALSGQYEYPRGVFYGGSRVEAECEQTQELIARFARGATNIAIMDIHSGLGKENINQIMINPLPKGASEAARAAFQREYAALNRMFPKDECRGLCEVQLPDEYAYVTTGDVTQWIYERFPEKREIGTVLSVTTEIGTRPAISVLEALIDENYCFWNYVDCGAERVREETARLRGMFAPPTERWQSQVTRAGYQMCKALNRFAKF